MSLSATLYLLDMGISNVLVQAYVEASGTADKERLNDLLSTTFLALTALGALGVAVFAGLAALLPGPFNIPHQYLHEASLIFIIAALVIQVGLPGMALEHVYQAFHRFDRVNQIQLATTTLQMILSVVVLAAGFRIVALALVQVAAALLRLVLYVGALPASVPSARLRLNRFNMNLFKTLMHVSKWAFLNNLSNYLFDMLAWVILGSLGSMRQAAMFGLASRAPKQLWNLVDQGANVALPQLSKSHAEHNEIGLKRTYLKALKLVFGAVLPFVLLGAFFARPLIEIWAGSQYAEAAIVMQWLLVAALSHAITYPSDQLLYACGEVRKAAIIAFWSGTISVVAAFLLVSRYGATGLAAGMALSQLCINCTWFTAAACKISGTSPTTLLRVLFEGLGWPLAALAIEIALIWGFSSHLSSLKILLAAVASGLVYLALWSLRTALPLYRNRTEIAA
jgi:O-antigen/teichoic acid export membrane protein